MRFTDRRQAGRALADRLMERRDAGTLTDPLIFGIPRGGVPVADEVARALHAPLDVLIARKIGAPGHPEFGVGAVAGEDPPFFDEDSLDRLGLNETDLAADTERERAELHRREELYRHGRPAPEVRDRTVVVVDDGLATGATARAALREVRGHGPARLVLAVPVCAADTAAALRDETDELITLYEPRFFHSVGRWYDDFTQLSDRDVLDILHVGSRGPSALRA